MNEIEALVVAIRTSAALPVPTVHGFALRVIEQLAGHGYIIVPVDKPVDKPVDNVSEQVRKPVDNSGAFS